MGARLKLNAAYWNGATLVASAIGLGLNSWSAFFVVLGLLVAAHTITGGIRSGA